MSGIDFDVWMESVERLRPTQHHNATIWEKDHDRVIWAAREKTPPVPWPRLSDFAKRTDWPASSQGALRERLRALKAMPEDERSERLEGK